MDAAVQTLIELGAVGAILVVVLIYLFKLTKMHNEERDKWRQDNNRHVEKFSDIVEKNTDAMSKLNTNIEILKDRV
jgi:hypothetical protein